MDLNRSLKEQGATVTCVAFVIWLADQIDAQDGGDFTIPETVGDEISRLGFEVKDTMRPVREDAG